MGEIKEELVHTSGFGRFYTKDDEKFMRFSLSDWDYMHPTGLLAIEATVAIAPVEPDEDKFVITPSGPIMTRCTDAGTSTWKVHHDVLYGIYWLKCNGYEEISTADYCDKWGSWRWLYDLK